MISSFQISPDEITASISLERIQSEKPSEFQSVSDVTDITRRTEIGSVTSIGDCSDVFDTESQYTEFNQDGVRIFKFIINSRLYEIFSLNKIK